MVLAKHLSYHGIYKSFVVSVLYLYGQCTLSCVHSMFVLLALCRAFSAATAARRELDCFVVMRSPFAFTMVRKYDALINTNTVALQRLHRTNGMGVRSNSGRTLGLSSEP